MPEDIAALLNEVMSCYAVICRMIGSTAAKAIAIPDEMVHLPAGEGDAAVISAPTEHSYVLVPGTALASCTCAESMQGSVCKHVMKVGCNIK